MGTVKRYSIKPVLKTDEYRNQYAAFEYEENASGMCVFYGDHKAALTAAEQRAKTMEEALKYALSFISWMPADAGPVRQRAAKVIDEIRAALAQPHTAHTVESVPDPLGRTVCGTALAYGFPIDKTDDWEERQDAKAQPRTGSQPE